MTDTANVAILAGGLGTRLQSRTGGLPKPMAPVLGKPVLEHLIELCAMHGFDRIALLCHHRVEAISEYFGDGSRWDVRLTYHIEREARGTAGALQDALHGLDDRFLVLYGDTYADIDLTAFWTAHEARPAAATLLVHPNDHPHDSDLVELGENGQILALHPYPHGDGNYPNLVNAAMYIMDRDSVAGFFPTEGKADIAKHSFPAMLSAGLILRAYVTPEYIKDMGTPERLDKVANAILKGVPERLSSRSPRSAVFLDRDGTINREVNHLARPEDLELLPGVGPAIRQINQSGVLAVCVTNQPVVARGMISIAKLDGIHGKLDILLGKERAYLDRLYYCPHHPDRGFAGEVSELKIDCDCRKPRTGLIDRAVEDLGIDRRQSWMVGDRTADIRAGARAGLRTVLVRTGFAGGDAVHTDRPDYIVPHLAAAVDWILKGHSKLGQQLLPFAAAHADARLVLVGGPSRSGKSMTAQRLAEIMRDMGRRVHLVELDGWLHPVEERREGAGVTARYDLAAFEQELALALAGTGHRLGLRHYDRLNRKTLAGAAHAIGPCDLIVVEGVAALLSAYLRTLADGSLFVDVGDAVRRQRLLDDYEWRGEDPAATATLIASREVDEVGLVRSQAGDAFRISGE